MFDNDWIHFADFCFSSDTIGQRNAQLSAQMLSKIIETLQNLQLSVRSSQFKEITPDRKAGFFQPAKDGIAFFSGYEADLRSIVRIDGDADGNGLTVAYFIAGQ